MTFRPSRSSHDDYPNHGCNQWTTGSESSALPQGYAHFGQLSIHMACVCREMDPLLCGREGRWGGWATSL